jgi:hypothetical protein
LAGDRDEKAWTEFMLEYYKVDKAELEEYPNGRPFPDPQKSYSPEEVVVPAPYPDTHAFREWMTHYYKHPEPSVTPAAIAAGSLATSSTLMPPVPAQLMTPLA